MYRSPSQISGVVHGDDRHRRLRTSPSPPYLQTPVSILYLPYLNMPQFWLPLTQAPYLHFGSPYLPYSVARTSGSFRQPIAPYLPLPYFSPSRYTRTSGTHPYPTFVARPASIGPSPASVMSIECLLDNEQSGFGIHLYKGVLTTWWGTQSSNTPLTHYKT